METPKSPVSLRTETPLELLIWGHYKSVFFQNEWTRSRVRRLCELLSINERELSRYIRVAPDVMVRYGLQNRYPPYVELLLELIERHTLTRVYGTQPEQPLFPELSA